MPVAKIMEAKTLTERTYQAIKDLILRNEFLPGQEVLLNPLAESLGVSQTPVREALAKLSADGLIDYAPHKTPRVSGITVKDLMEIYEVRRLIEPYCATRVILLIQKDKKMRAELEALQTLTQEILKASPAEFDHDKFLAVDFELDRIFRQAAGQTFLGEVFGLTGARSLRIRTYVEAVSQENTEKQEEIVNGITREHAEIIRAILDGDMEKTKACVQWHLKNGEQRTLKAMQDKLEQTA